MKQVVFGTPRRVYAMFAWACGGCKLDPALQSAPQPGTFGMDAYVDAARDGDRTARTATVFDGNQLHCPDGQLARRAVALRRVSALLWRAVLAVAKADCPPLDLGARPRHDPIELNGIMATFCLSMIYFRKLVPLSGSCSRVTGGAAWRHASPVQPELFGPLRRARERRLARVRNGQIPQPR